MLGFIDALIAECNYYSKQYPETKIKTLYMGGGTPSMLSPTLLKRLFAGINEHFDLSELTELTFEANPTTFTSNGVRLYKELGITRISLGVQSFSDRILTVLGREHSRQLAIDSVKMLQDVGMNEINIDLMFAVPGQPLQEWQDTLSTAVKLSPDHISCYNLTYEEDTAFIEKLTSGEYSEDEELDALYFETCHDTLTSAGFLHYETSNYAKPGKKSQHNQSYWNGADYLGIGPSAVGTVNLTRHKNIPDTDAYIRMVDHIGHARHEIENLSADDYRTERIALLLRTSDGLHRKWLSHVPQEEIDLLLREKLAIWENDKLHLINTGPMLVDSIAERLV